MRRAMISNNKPSTIEAPPPIQPPLGTLVPYDPNQLLRTGAPAGVYTLGRPPVKAWRGTRGRNMREEITLALPFPSRREHPMSVSASFDWNGRPKQLEADTKRRKAEAC